ncbi:sensor histidine kinase [Paraburkholderia sp. SARCC-3016]|uniref:sensor histidine kinase n=1 Tax=Paraburkholderia sp. SARCC-3016 TaxID=3058611 RepID=UPI00280700FE|nr:sensor histidine kinase [Paraburkholderia sp. SARCC-3016]MDQ7976038.1 sensor histidine kinase [Paraburkholderia sp. SARCC-3016]
MRLAEFIALHMDEILAQWEAFAATLQPAARNMGSPALRDHAQQILQAVAKDISTPQTRDEQHEKSLGHAPKLIDAPETAAQTHALLRARSGFSVNQLAAEYRALRASVLRLWMDNHAAEDTNLEDVIRFNEAIDQAVAESVEFFNDQVEQARNLLLGMLGHDMRSPLQTIQMTAAYLAALNAGGDVSDAAARLIRSGSRMQSLLDDLCDFNRIKLGLGINIVPADVDLAVLIADALDQLRAAHPGRLIELDVAGRAQGVWDGARLQQLLANLVGNALKYGNQTTPVRVALTGEASAVSLEVSNSGPPIDPQTIETIFDPLRRGPGEDSRNASGLGLGLYIAAEIAKAHGGRIEVRSDENQTVFAVRLPCHQRAA